MNGKTKKTAEDVVRATGLSPREVRDCADALATGGREAALRRGFCRRDIDAVESFAKKSSSKKPAAKKSSSKKPAEKPAPKKSATKKPAAKKSSSSKKTKKSDV